MVQNRYNLALEIVLLLLRGERHLRNIARGLNAPHATVLRKLNELVKENALEYRKEGRNKIFSIKKTLQARNYVHNAERYKMLELVKRYPELGIVIEDILKKTDKRLIVLFGSYAKFSAKKDSDIDIYVETKDRKVKESIESAYSRIRVKIGAFDSDSMLIREIIKNHVILRGVEEFYEKTGLFE